MKRYVIALLLLLVPSICYSAYRYNSSTGTRDYCAGISDVSGDVESKQCEDIKIDDGSLTDEGDFFLIKAGAASGGYTSMTTGDTAVDVSYSYTKKAIASDPAFQTGTLPDGNIGKLLTIEITERESEGDTFTLSPTTSEGFETITFYGPGDFATFLYIDDTYGWIIVASSGTIKDDQTDELTIGAGINFPDNVESRFGNDNDLQIYHDGSNSKINNDTGRLDLTGSVVLFGDSVYFTQTDGAEKIDSDSDGYLDYYAGTSHDFIIGSEGQVTIIDSGFYPVVSDDVNIGSSDLYFKNQYINNITFLEDALLPSPTQGTLEFSNDRLYLTNVATQRAIDRTSDVVTATATIDGDAGADGTTETTIYTGMIEANALKVGNILKFHANGVISNNANDDITMKIYLGSSEIFSQLINLDPVTGGKWHMDGNMTVRTVGVGGTMAYHMDIDVDDNVYEIIGLDNIDTTITEDFKLTGTWASANTSNVMSLYQGYTEFKN